MDIQELIELKEAFEAWLATNTESRVGEAGMRLYSEIPSLSQKSVKQRRPAL